MDKKTMDFYNGLDASSRDHSKVTKQHFGDRKYALITALIFALLADAFLLVEMILTTGQVKYYIAPILIVAVDAVFLCIVPLGNLNQRYMSKYPVLFLLSTIALVVVTLIMPSHAEARSMTYIALGAFGLTQALKVVCVLILFRIGKHPSSAKGLTANAIIVVCILLFGLAAYGSWSIKVGVMGQNVSVVDENCTLIYRLTEGDEYEIVGSFGDGNVINVPATFNGKPVRALDCMLLDGSIDKIKVANKDFRFENATAAGEINEDLVIEVTKSNIDEIRLGLFRDSWNTSGNKTSAAELFGRVAPVDLEEGETYFNVSYESEMTGRSIGYIPTIYKKGGAEITLDDLKEKLDPEKKKLLEHSNVKDQGDLAYCYDNNDGMILAKGEAGENDFALALEKIYRFSIGQSAASYCGNDKKWAPTESDRVSYSIASDLVAVFDRLPERNGFNVVWKMRVEDGEDHVVEGGADFRAFAEGEIASSFELEPLWEIVPPSIERVDAPAVTITYGQNANLAILTSCAFPVQYTLKKGNTTLNVKQLEPGNWTFAMEGKRPLDSGTYTLSMAANPGEALTSLGLSESVTQDYTFTVNKKTLRLNWTLPMGQFTNAAQPVTVAYEEADRVGDDVIEITKDRESATNAGVYAVTASMDTESSKKYIFVGSGVNANKQTFSIEKKQIVVDWDDLSYVYNGTKQAPIASTEVFNVSEYLVVTGAESHAGNYEAVAVASERDENDNGVTITPENYEIVQNGTKAYVIAKKTVTVGVWSRSVFIYDGKPFSVNAEELVGYVDGEEEVSLDDLVYQDNEETAAGDYTLSATFKYGSNYTFGEGEAAVVTKDFTIEPKEIGYEWGTSVFDYNKSLQCPIAVALEKDLCDNDECGFLFEGAATDAGEYDAEIVGVTNANYKLAVGTHVLHYTINKIKRASLSLSYADRTYGDEAPTPVVSGNEEEGTPSYAYRVDEDEAPFGAAVPIEAGSYVVRLTTAESKNYLETTAEKHYTILPRPITVSWSDVDLVYSKSDKVPVPTVTNKVGSDVVTLSSELTMGNNYFVGSFRFSVTEIKDNANYTMVGGQNLASAIYQITPFEITLSWEEPAPSALVYSGTEKKVGATAQGLFAGDICNVTTALTAGKNATDVGVFTYTATAIDNDNYKLGDALVSGEYAITPKAATVTVKPVAIKYGAGIPAFEYETDGIVFGDQLSGVVTYTTSYDPTDPEKRGIGDYTVKAGGLNNDNYDLSFPNATLTVEPRVVTVDWDHDTYVYDKNEHLPVATVTNLAYAGDELTLSYDVNVAKTAVGDYSRTVNDLGGSEKEN
ncbi:MAG: hypothetical protein J5765_01825, partial [Clostridia bacterium]|nr:hypothetical protein [Clostridia bacterium]